MARCLGTGMQQEDESSHSHDITTTGAKTHEQRGGIHPASRKFVLLCTNCTVDPVQFSRSAALPRRQSAVLGCDRASVVDVGTLAAD